jgi:NAD(P)-dependent dehydrogenase (short-subunit alcohol dehydrogenase family)
MGEKRLENKVAWVTGSSRGIGRVIAAHLAGMGASVVVHGTTPYSTRAFGEADSLEDVAAAIAAEHHVAVLPVHGDLSDEATVKAMVAQIQQRFGRIDILVNCAGGDIGAQGATGANAGKPLANDAIHMSLTDMRSVLDRNLMTCILVCREVAPDMMQRKEGWIVNIGSDAGLIGIGSAAIYATAKAAVHEYTRCLSAFLREYNVRVNAVAPGGIVTPRFLASRPIDESRRVREGTLDRYGWPDEIAKVVAFLVTDDSSFVNGQVLRVDAGRQLFPA